jgi:type VI protein secretion system component Hcp
MEFAQIYLRLRDDSGALVAGDVQTKGHEGDIHLNKWGWGFKMEPEDGKSAPPESYFKASLVGLTKPVDAASLKLINLFHAGICCKEAVLYMKQSMDEVVSVKMSLQHVTLMAYDLDVTDDGNEVALSENWTLRFDSLKIEYTQPGPNNRRITHTFEAPSGMTVDGSPPEGSSTQELMKYSKEQLLEAIKAKDQQAKPSNASK